MYEELLISGDHQPTQNPKIYKSNESFPSESNHEESYPRDLSRNIKQ